MKLAECKGHWALVTGASSGIGREFARRLAAAGMNLVLVARRESRLQELASALAAEHHIETLVVPADLAERGAAARIKTRTEERGIKVRLLCNSAAFGRWGRFERGAPQEYEAMIAVNAGAVAALCRAFFDDLRSHGTSAVINVSSPAALQPMPFMTAYAGTKAFVHAFSQALYGEWQEYGIHVQTLVPGPTATEFDELAGAYPSALKDRGDVAKVVEVSLRNLGNGRPIAASAKGLFRQRVFAGLFPPATVIRAVARMFRPPAG